MKKYISLIALILFANTLHAMKEDSMADTLKQVTIGEITFNILPSEDGQWIPYLARFCEQNFI